MPDFPLAAWCRRTALCCLLGAAAAWPASAGAKTVYFCVDNATGAVRVVSKKTQCSQTRGAAGERRLTIKSGKRGARGADGPAGPQGPIGPAGPVGARGAAGTAGTAGAVGPSGVALGGGVEADPGNVIRASRPNPTTAQPTGWAGVADVAVGSPSFKVYVVCTLP